MVIETSPQIVQCGFPTKRLLNSSGVNPLPIKTILAFVSLTFRTHRSRLFFKTL
jgi:hypothetical protein